MRTWRKILPVALAAFLLYLFILFLRGRENFSTLDYIYLLFMSVEDMEIYQQAGWDMLLVMAQLLLLGLGIHHVLSDLREMNRGMRQWVALRLSSIRRYIGWTQRRCLLLGLQYVAAAAISLMLALFCTHPQSFRAVSSIHPFTLSEIWALALLGARYLVWIQISGLVGMYFLTRRLRYELLLGDMLIGCALLLAADSFGFVAFRIAPIGEQTAALLVLCVLYALLVCLVTIRMKAPDGFS
ncbi:MAG: hypothetical protein ACLU6B_05395 [Lachnospirales bacterium]